MRKFCLFCKNTQRWLWCKTNRQNYSPRVKHARGKVTTSAVTLSNMTQSWTDTGNESSMQPRSINKSLKIEPSHTPRDELLAKEVAKLSIQDKSAQEYQANGKMDDNYEVIDMVSSSPSNTPGNTSENEEKPALESSPQRQWITTPFGKNFRQRDYATFTLMSYNILAQSILNVTRFLYSKNDPVNLAWPNRLNCLIEEIGRVRPHILTLQEVQADHLNEIEKRLRDMNLTKYFYKKRTGDQNDGCAIFYSGDMFDVISSEMVEYYQPTFQVLDRHNVAIIVKFALKEQPQVQFIVSTTHLLYNPRLDDVRLAQTQILLAELDRMAYRQLNQRDSRHEDIPIILTGDFNTEFSSETYRLIHGGNASSKKARGLLFPFQLGITDNCQHFGVARMNQRQRTSLHNSGRQQSDRNVSLPKLDYSTMKQSRLPFNTGRLTHGLNLTSAIPYSTSNREPVASTYHNKWITVDYIFYTKFRTRSQHSSRPAAYSPLQLISYLNLPTVNECYANGPIPNANIGSDHYSLAAQFVIYSNR